MLEERVRRQKREKERKGGRGRDHSGFESLTNHKNQFFSMCLRRLSSTSENNIHLPFKFWWQKVLLQNEFIPIQEVNRLIITVACGWPKLRKFRAKVPQLRLSSYLVAHSRWIFSALWGFLGESSTFSGRRNKDCLGEQWLCRSPVYCSNSFPGCSSPTSHSHSHLVPYSFS